MKAKNMIIASLLLLAPFAAVAEITVQDVWVRMPPPVADTAAAYMTIKNSGDQDVEIISVESDAAKRPEFHSMSMHDNMMHMQKMERAVVPAHGSIKFAPGGDHLMLKALRKKLKKGDHVMLRLNMRDGGSVEAHAEVRDMRHISNHHGGGHHH